MQPWFKKNKHRKGKYHVYVLRCCDDRYYVGESGNIIERLYDHICRNGAVFTKKHPPCELVHLELINNYSDACKMEIKVRKMVADGWRDFYLPSGYEELFYRIMAFASSNDLMENPKKFKEDIVRIKDFIDLPKFKTTKEIP